MHRLRPAVPRRLDDGIDAQIAVTGGGRADAHRLIGQAHVPGTRVSLRIHRYRSDAEPAARGHDAAGDLAAIGDKNFFEHGSASPARLALVEARGNAFARLR